MNLLDILLGRTKPTKPKGDRIFAIATAYVTFTTQLGLQAGEKAGLCFRPMASSPFTVADTDLTDLLRLSAKQTATDVRQLKDEYGFQWVILEDKDFEDLVSTIHMASETLTERGFGEQLLAAVFKFMEGAQPVYWIYAYKQGAFYLFAPLPGQRQRDNATELRLSGAVARELPIERQLEKWYALWGVPF